MSEAAAAVLLETDESNDTPAYRAESPPPAGRGTSRGIYLDRCAMAADATHLTGSDPGGSVLRHLLARVIDNRPADLIHAHGTGTTANDEIELAAIEATVAGLNGRIPDARPVLYSHKGALGHSLGAAGLLSVVLNCQSHATGVVPPNVQTRDPLPTTRLHLCRDPVALPVRRSIAVAAGFGGAIAAVGLSS
jgi:3-oxoacyl-(acyl-carrier-protein) synthase